MTTYVFMYDFKQVGRTNPQLVSFIKNNKFIEDWSTPYDGMFFLKSSSDPRSLVSMITEYFQQTVTFFVAPYYANGGGSVSREVWDWLQANVGNVIMLENQP